MKIDAHLDLVRSAGESAPVESAVEALEVKIVDSVEGVEALRKDWESLQWHPNADIDFFLTIVGRPGVLHPLVLVFYSKGRPVLLAAGRVEGTGLDVKIGYKVFLRPIMRQLTLLYGGILGDLTPQRANRLMEELIRAMRTYRLETVFLSSLAADGVLLPIARRRSGLLRRDYLPTTRAHWQMTLPATPEELVKSLEADTKFQFKRLQRYRRSLDKECQGKVKIHCLSSPQDVDRICEEAESVSKDTYLRELGAGFVNDLDNRRRLDVLAKKGLLRAFLLEVGGKTTAFWIGTRYGPVFYLDYTGYRPEHRKYNVGTILFVEMAKSVCSEGVTGIDFGFGDAFYKQRFGNKTWEETSIHVFSRSPRPLAINAVRTAIGSLEVALRRMVSSLHLEGTIKKMWRRKLEKAEPAGEE